MKAAKSGSALRAATPSLVLREQNEGIIARHSFSDLFFVQNFKCLWLGFGLPIGDLLEIGATKSSVRRRSNEAADGQKVGNGEKCVGRAGDTQKNQVNATRTNGRRQVMRQVNMI